LDNTRQISKSYTINAANTWEKKTITIPPDTTGQFDNDNASSLQLNFWLAVGSNFSSGALNSSAWATNVATNRAVGQLNLANLSGNYWAVTGVQLETGTVATPYEWMDYGTELRKCQRYFYKTFNQSTAPANSTDYRDGIGVNPIGVAYTNSAMRSIIAFPQPMRAKPTIVYFDTDIVAGSGTWAYYNGSVWADVTLVTTGESSELYVSANIDKTGLTFGYTYLTSGQLTASAEL
jgi:hypothetical protein